MTQEQSKFTHTPIAPEVPAGHEWQRWFLGTTGDRDVSPESDPYVTYAQVFRDGTTNAADVSLSTRRQASRFTAELKLSPAGLRELAHRLLDAAHDIEANPAKESK